MLRAARKVSGLSRPEENIAGTASNAIAALIPNQASAITRGRIMFLNRLRQFRMVKFPFSGGRGTSNLLVFAFELSPC